MSEMWTYGCHGSQVAVYESITHFQQTAHHEYIARCPDELRCRQSRVARLESRQVVAELTMIRTHESEGKIRICCGPPDEPIARHFDPQHARALLRLVRLRCVPYSLLHRFLFRIEICVLVCIGTDWWKEADVCGRAAVVCKLAQMGWESARARKLGQLNL